MPLNWIDTTDLSLNNLMLLERAQISWLPGWVPDREMALALQANPHVAWFLRHKCPEVAHWLDKLESMAVEAGDPQTVFAAEQTVLQTINDLMVYAIDPGIYDRLSFLGWDDHELNSLVDLSGKVALDIGAGTGRLAFAAAGKAAVVFAVEPVGNLRRYLKDKARRLGYRNFYTVDGLVTEIPFPDGFVDVTLTGHVYGDHPEEEIHELERVTKPGGMVILCPGTSENEEPAHQVLVAHGYNFSWFEEPGDGMKRKYWKTL
jgi:SAM-dependent methyltransferase